MGPRIDQQELDNRLNRPLARASHLGVPIFDPQPLGAAGSLGIAMRTPPVFFCLLAECVAEKKQPNLIFPTKMVFSKS